jgi:hypothetical protein
VPSLNSTGIRAEPSHAEVHRWRYAQTLAPFARGTPLQFHAGTGIGHVR